MSRHKGALSAAEIASLWTAYINDSMAKCILSFMLQHIEDVEIKSCVRKALDMSSLHIKKLTKLFEDEHFTEPIGFNDTDVNMNAPKLFMDSFCLSYVIQMARVGLLGHGGALAMSIREDIRALFTESLAETSKLYNDTATTAIEKSVIAKHPVIDVPTETDYIDSKKYLSGLNPFAQKRPLNAIEIAHLYTNVLTNTVGINLCLGFGQTSPNKEVQEFMIRGKEICTKHITIFTSTLLENDIVTPQLPDLCVSSSTTQTFSDKLIMFHMSLLNAAGTGNYATAAAASQRLDLALNYERLSVEIAEFAKSGADLMIKNNWLEQPPGTKNRKQLAIKKE